MSRNTVNLVQEDSGQSEEKIVAKTPVEVQRMKLAKLMSNPSKIVPIPERPKEKTMAAPADFVRNVMGSSAGAGSGEFHVYRRIRRRECTREKLMQEKSEKELKDEEFQRQIEEKKKALEEKTAKKRQKRLKKKQKAKDPKKQKVETQEKSEENKSDESDENEED